MYLPIAEDPSLNIAPIPTTRRPQETHRICLLKRVNNGLKRCCQVGISGKATRNGGTYHLAQATRFGGQCAITSDSCNFSGSAGNYRLMRQQSLAFHGIALVLGFALARGTAASTCGGHPAGGGSAFRRSAASQATVARRPNAEANPQTLFSKGQTALQSGDLDAAEAAFRQVIAIDPESGAAYSNLGVIAMRRKEWDHAISLLHKAEKLEPKVAGIRLNIGLVEYRRGNYAAAIAPLSSVVRDQPDSQQARYLLGLCHFLTEHYSEAVSVLEPLWPQMSSDFMYLYVLGNAAHSAGQTELDEKALKRLVEVGGDTAQFHLIMGKAYLNRQEPERDLPDNYEQLGVLYQRMEKYDDAEKSFREALQHDAKTPTPYFGLAKIHQRK